MKFIEMDPDHKSINRILVTIALICLIASLSSWISGQIDEYNADVRREEMHRQTEAKYGARFAVDYGPDYRPLYRNILLLLAGIGFLLTLRRKLILLTIVPYLIAVPVVYDWIFRTMRDLSYASSGYMADSPYWLKIASPYDWAAFSLMALTMGVIMFLIARLLTSRLKRTEANL